ncbi:MAG: GNAT family N-acetyltransferase [Armatimonadetes bacterium]|nr:GNAT family N-acetyltransferase [Armatimonadota bacterium]
MAPQLMMHRAALADLPPVALPPGYAVRSLRRGEGADWVRIINESFNRADPPQSFDPRMRQDSAFRPERVLFVVHGEEPVATASAWVRSPFGHPVGYLHMVGTRPAHAGQKLGYAVSLAALHRLAEEGFGDCYLHTDDFRLAAVLTYLRLGFRPVLIHENQRERWPAVLRLIGVDPAEFESVLRGPVTPMD